MHLMTSATKTSLLLNGVDLPGREHGFLAAVGEGVVCESAHVPK